MEIKQLNFSILSPFQIEAQSVCEVKETSLYERRMPRRPKRNGPCDLRMGTTDRLPCETCGHDIIKCPGHFGHLNLHTPMYHTGFLSSLLKVLRCVCYFCSTLLVEREVVETATKDSDVRDVVNLVMGLSKSKQCCRECGGAQPKYLRNGNTIRHEFPDGACFPEGDEEVASQSLTAAFVQQILTGIEQRDVELLGFKADSRPEWMVLEKLCIPPPIIRPSIKPNDDSRARGEDDITLELQEILKLDTKLANSSKPAERKLLEEELQAHIGMYIHHDSKASGTTGGAVNFGHGAPHSNRERRFYHKRLKGKHGRMRHNLNGKRVEKCARSVVSPGPKYDIDEVGVPRSIALRLTLTEKVNRHNVEALTRRVHNGPNRLDGAASVVQEDGTDIDLSLLADPRTIVLCSGWSVRRYVSDGDVVLFNRQPSLHKMSIMAHTVRLTDDLTFRLPVCNATPYNADFDGDEMLSRSTYNTLMIYLKN